MMLSLLKKYPWFGFVVWIGGTVVCVTYGCLNAFQAQGDASRLWSWVGVTTALLWQSVLLARTWAAWGRLVGFLLVSFLSAFCFLLIQDIIPWLSVRAVLSMNRGLFWLVFGSILAAFQASELHLSRTTTILWILTHACSWYAANSRFLEDVVSPVIVPGVWFVAPLVDGGLNGVVFSGLTGMVIATCFSLRATPPEGTVPVEQRPSF